MEEKTFKTDISWKKNRHFVENFAVKADIFGGISILKQTFYEALKTNILWRIRVKQTLDESF